MKRFFLFLGLIIILSLFGIKCSDVLADKRQRSETDIVITDETGYKEAWKAVRKFQIKGLPKSALKITEKIYEKAKREKNAEEIVKSLIHKIYYLQYVEEESLVKIQKELHGELKESIHPVTPMIHSMIAEQYWNYYQRNRYRFLKRTTTVGFKEDDMRTWDLKKIVETVVYHYRESLKDIDKLKKTPVEIYDKIIYKGYNGRKYRPTLYDFLTHRAIDFFMNKEAGLTKPVYQFTINNKDYFQENKKFVKLKIITKDPLSFHFYALKYLQDLIKFHLNDKNREALIDVDLKRLRFIYGKAVVSNKELIYEDILKKMAHKNKGSVAAADIYYELASLYFKLGNKFKPDRAEQYKMYKVKAYRLCKNTIKNYPKTTGSSNSMHLINRIEGKKLKLKFNKVAVPEKSFRAFVMYRNVKKLFFRIVKTSKKEKEELNRLSNNDMIGQYLAKRAMKKWHVYLPVDKDYQNHSTEIEINGLKPGKYIILCGNSEKFNYKNNAVAFSFLDVSNISYVKRSSTGSGLEFHVLARDTGMPLKKTRVQLWYREWSSSWRKYYMKKGRLYRVNKNGFFKIKYGSLKSSYYYLEFINGKDRLFPEHNYYSYRPYKWQRNSARTFFFTDRAIYRPGQTVYFKGIKLRVDNKDGEKNSIIKKSSSRVVFYDVNSQKAGELDLVTNEFGTFSGSFKIPVGLLNGRMRISDGYGTHYFSVEEYKRPKFEITFQPSTKSYRVNDTVEIKGNAKAYAGYNIDNAVVKYRVVRNVFYPYYWYFWGYTPPSPRMEILNGTTKTDEKGEFTVKFKAVPDLSISKKSMPAFNYKIHADVTDLNGETRSSSKSVSIGYTALKLNVYFSAKLDKVSRNYTFSINSANLSGEFLGARGSIGIYRLKTPERIFRNRNWQKPDKHVIKRNAFYKKFSNDIYSDETNVLKWKRSKKVFSSHFDTSKSKKIKLKKINRWKSGKYVIELKSRDRYGNRVKEIKYFTLYSSKEKKPPYKLLDWFAVPKGTAEPGEKAVVLIGSSDRRVRVIYEVEYRGSIIKKKYLTLNREQKKIIIPIKEKHRGNISLHFTFVKHNRSFYHNRNIYVPWSNKELDISFETFRNKLTPGEKEEWRIKIRGKKRDFVAAEMAATLYDASLDAFKKNSWGLNIFPGHYSRHSWSSDIFGTINTRIIGKLKKYSSYSGKRYDRLNWFGFYWRSYYRRHYKSKRRYKNGSKPMKTANGKPALKKLEGASGIVSDEIADMKKSKKKDLAQEREETGKEMSDENGSGRKEKLSGVKARTNFNETAFFYPHLKTNKNGEIIVSFTIPEALTKWKMLGFAHTKNLEYGFIMNELVTQKDLMVVPNAPRFLRENDSLVFTSKVTNLSDKVLTGDAALLLFDSATRKPVDLKFNNKKSRKSFSVKKGQSSLLSWKIRVPEDINAVTYRVVAKAGNFSDGEEMVLPILKNRMLVTETLPLPVRSKETKTFKFQKLIDSGNSSTLRHHKLTLEFTSNPAWYAVQALPYIMEYPYECLEQTFSRFYANSIASYIVNKNPRIKKIYDKWAKEKSSNVLLSNLEKNQELKSLLLQETPWVLNAKNETERKKRVALLFDMNRMTDELGRALKKIVEGQMPSGAWPWFKGMRENRYITQHIINGFAHLDKLNVVKVRENRKLWGMIKKAMHYLDRKIKRDYDRLIKNAINLEKNNLGYIQIQYLYARSCFKNIEMHEINKKAFRYYLKQAKEYWLESSLYMQGMIALAMERYKDHNTALVIVKSIKEHSLYSDEMGLYWKTSYGYNWYQAPIETHALLIEVFSEITNDRKAVDDMKTWLLKQKQTQDWKTTKATVEAIYALLLQGDDWLANDNLADITIGKIKIDPEKMKNVKVEEGTGYFKTSWPGSEILPEMGNVKVVNNNSTVAWGGLYWQYFENLDKITPHKTPLKLTKKLFVQKNTSTGPVLYPIDKQHVKIGDRIKVRITLRVDRSMEYVHMKDMRASGFEPENVISRYKWQDGLGYYESTKDASTNFFMDYLPRGTYVFEYSLRVTHKGDFSNGITTIQCMYAPEFASHSEGVRVKVE